MRISNIYNNHDVWENPEIYNSQFFVEWGMFGLVMKCLPNFCIFANCDQTCKKFLECTHSRFPLSFESMLFLSFLLL